MPDNKKLSVRQDIQTAANYHPGGRYAFGGGSPNQSNVAGENAAAGTLTYYSSLELQADSLAEQFYALSAVPQRGRNPKIFAVGILPPNQKVTGKLLDRTATIARDLPPEQLAPRDSNSGDNPDGTPIEEEEYAEPETPNTANNKDRGKFNPATDLDAEFWQQYVAMCRRLKQDPTKMGAVLYLESNFNPAAQNVQGNPRHVVAQGLNQYTEGIAKNPKVGNMTDEEWANMSNMTATEQLVYVERYFKNAPANSSTASLYQRNFGGYTSNPDGSLYASKAQQEAWIATHPNDVFKDSEKQQRAIEQNGGSIGKGFVTADPVTGFPTIRRDIFAVKTANLPPRSVVARIQEAEAFLDGGGTTGPLPIASDSDPTLTWNNDGAENAQTAKKHQGRLANTDLRATPLGLALEAAQKAHIQAIQNALKAMAEAPPLRMLVNPSNFSVKSQKIVQDGNWGRDGPIIEFWGDDQDKISGSGKVAGFYAIDKSPSFNGGGPGLTRSARNFSQAWQNFQALWLMYKNNGAVYLQDMSTQDKRTTLSTVGSVYIYYDNILYIGSFDSFNITETADKPFSAEYSFEFTVRAAFLLDQPPEADPITNRQSLLQNQTQFALPTRSNITPDSPIVQQNGSQGARDLLVSGNTGIGGVFGGNN